MLVAGRAGAVGERSGLIEPLTPQLHSNEWGERTPKRRLQVVGVDG